MESKLKVGDKVTLVGNPFEGVVLTNNTTYHVFELMELDNEPLIMLGLHGVPVMRVAASCCKLVEE